MKKCIILALLVLCPMLSYAVDSATNGGAETQYPHTLDPVHALPRAVVNLATCWIEYPRCLMVENAEHPVFGIGTGLLQGTFFMTTRIILSVADVLMLGCTGPSAYDAHWLPENVFQAQWNPYVGEFSGTNAPHATPAPVEP